jgi:hypothetical protein
MKHSDRPPFHVRDVSFVKNKNARNPRKPRMRRIASYKAWKEMKIAYHGIED